MKKFSYYKFSPAGNTTIFLSGRCDKNLRTRYCAEALSLSGIFAEQAAWADIGKKHFDMCGDEFCINACRAFGALLDLQDSRKIYAREYLASIGSFGEISLSVKGQLPVWDVAVSFQLSSLQVKTIDSCHIQVDMPGITHLLAECEQFPDTAKAPFLAGSLLAKHNIILSPAAGVIWWKKTEDLLEIMPFVQVGKAGTAMLESSCGSGSLALAMAIGTDCQIIQPSGDRLAITINSRNASVQGPVILVSKGSIWLKSGSALEKR